MKGDGRYPNKFFMIYPVELPKARRYGETEDIIMPVSPGIIAPPKNKTIQRRMQRVTKSSVKGIKSAEPIPITENTRT